MILQSIYTGSIILAAVTNKLDILMILAIPGFELISLKN